MSLWVTHAFTPPPRGREESVSSCVMYIFPLQVLCVTRVTHARFGPCVTRSATLHLRTRSRTFTAEVHRRAGGRVRSCTTFAQVRPSTRDVYVNTAESARRARRNDDLSKSLRNALLYRLLIGKLKLSEKCPNLFRASVQVRVRAVVTVCRGSVRTVRKVSETVRNARTMGAISFTAMAQAEKLSETVRKVSGVNGSVACARGGHALQGKCPKVSAAHRRAGEHRSLLWRDSWRTWRRGTGGYDAQCLRSVFTLGAALPIT